MLGDATELGIGPSVSFVCVKNKVQGGGDSDLHSSQMIIWASIREIMGCLRKRKELDSPGCNRIHLAACYRLWRQIMGVNGRGQKLWILGLIIHRRGDGTKLGLRDRRKGWILGPSFIILLNIFSITSYLPCIFFHLHPPSSALYFLRRASIVSVFAVTGRRKGFQSTPMFLVLAGKAVQVPSTGLEMMEVG